MKINRSPRAPNILNEPIILWLLSVFPLAPEKIFLFSSSQPNLSVPSFHYNCEHICTIFNIVICNFIIFIFLLFP
jgi:hypothetical protein